MTVPYKERLRQLRDINQDAVLKLNLIGLEKESLRVSQQGTIAQTPHPKSLGSALTHPYVTTDYSEALLELITPPKHNAAQALAFLQRTEQFVYSQLQDEILWCTSMPCVLGDDSSIPIAQYGSSNAGLMKTIYRRGLGYRYGRMMQVIAGIHFNFSLSDEFWTRYQSVNADQQTLRAFASEQYFRLIRNLQRNGWLVAYLFGASPAVCRSFMDGIEKILQPFDEYTYFGPFATSLRLGDIGYQNYKEGKSGIKANYDSLAGYIESLRHAIQTPYAPYEKIGVKVGNDYRQLNANLLQIENEYYSTIRPKQITGKYEKPVVALRERGVQYVELRSPDVNVFEPLGVNLNQLHFLEAFLIYCLLQDSPHIDKQERHEIDHNQNTTAHRGRQPGLKLLRHGGKQLLTAWAKDIGEDMRALCEIMDNGHQDAPYQRALDAQLRAIEDPDLTPSARFIAEMRREKESFYRLSMRYALLHADYFRHLPLDPQQLEFYRSGVEKSLQEQLNIESSNSLDFDTFLNRYFAEQL